MTFPRGRLLELSGQTGPSGYRLGPGVGGVRSVVADGERATIGQRADWTDGAPTLLRFHADVRGSLDAFILGDKSWTLSVHLDGQERLAYPLSSTSGSADGSRPRLIEDAALPLLGLAGADSTVEFRLSFADSAGGEVEVELPAAALGKLVLDDVLDSAVINRVPAPGQVNVAVGGPGSYAQDLGLAVEFHVPSASPPAGAHPLENNKALLYVNGVLAWMYPDGDLPGYTTGLVALDGGRTARMTTVLDDPLPPNSEVAVRLYVEFDAGGSLEWLWSFFTEDLAAPALESAQATSLTSVRVVWNENVLAEDPAGAADALNPANWSLELLSASLADGLPAVLPTVTSVTRVDGRTFDLALSTEATRGARYEVVAVNVVDLAYEPNPVAPPDTRAEFVGFAPQQPVGRHFSMLDWLPRMNVEEDTTGDLRAFIACLQEVADLLLGDVDRFVEIFDSDRAEERFLGAILQGLGNPFRFVLGEIDKRRLARLLVPIYQLKGTDRGIIDAVRLFVGVEVQIVPSPAGTPWRLGRSHAGVDTYLGGSSLYTLLSFWVRVEQALTDEQRARITAIVEYAKRAECHFRGFLEPAPIVPPGTPYWRLGTSRAGVDTILALG